MTRASLTVRARPAVTAGRAGVPHWWVAWLALWAAVPLVNWWAVTQVRSWRRLPGPLRLALGTAVLLPVLSACWTPAPGTSALLAALRGAFTVGLVMTGWRLGHARRLVWLLPGLLLVLAEALVYSQGHGGLLHGRLTHPFYQMVSLGLAAALVLWVCVYGPERGSFGRARWLQCPPRVWRWARAGMGMLAGGVLLLGGSRAPLTAALLGLLLPVLLPTAWSGLRPAVRRRGLWCALLLTVSAGGWVAFSARHGAGGTHLAQAGLNSRDTYWEEAANVWRAGMPGGAGTGQLGNAARSTQDNCFQGWATRNVGCPAWVQRLAGEPWFAPVRKVSWMAHNVLLHGLAETGLVGTLGTFLVLGMVLAAGAASRQPLLMAVLAGFTVVNLTDNVTLLPSLAVSEVFWLVGGVALREADRVRRGSLTPVGVLGPASAWGGGVLLLSLLPVLLPSVWPHREVPTPRLLVLNGARLSARTAQTTMFLGLADLPAGPSRLRLERCTPVCGVERVQDVTPDARGEWWGGLELPALTSGEHVRLQLLPPQDDPRSARVLAETSWVQP